MIIENGYIQIKKQEGGGLLNGIPQPIKERWCEPIPCNIRKNKSDHRGTYIDGKFIQTSSTILIEENDFTAKRLRLVDNRGTELGEFEIQDIQYLESVGATQITV